MPDTAYCYHCGRHHPKSEMRQMNQKGVLRWRCIKSIEAARKSQSERDAYGKDVTAMNSSAQQTRSLAYRELDTGKGR